MSHLDLDQILSLIGQYGYLIVFLGVLLESAGVPLPGETILIAAGAMVQRGHLDLGDAIVFGIIGAALGDQIGYWVGREGGRPFVLRWGRYVKITPNRLGRAEGFFARQGGKAVFLARFVAGLRVFGALVAGMSRMRWRTFLFYNVVGGASWATAAVLVGYFLGGSLDLVERWAGRASALLFALIALTLALYLAYRWVSNHPERIRRAANRLEGGRLRAFLRTPFGRWLRRRFSPGEIFGLTFTVGLVSTGLFSWAFGGVVQDVLAGDPLVRVDRHILHFVYSHGDSGAIAAVTVFEALFSPELLLLAGVLAGALLAVLGYRRGSFRLGFSGAVLLATVLGTGALAELFKILFQHDRPPAYLQLVPEAGYGFPSSHAVASVAVGAAVWYVFSLRPKEGWGGSWQAKARVGFAVVSVALLVGMGRLYMGAHYLSDVLAGWALGGVWASVCLTAAEVFRRLREANGSTGSGSIEGPTRGDERNQAQDDRESPPPRPWWRRHFQHGIPVWPTVLVLALIFVLAGCGSAAGNATSERASTTFSAPSSSASAPSGHVFVIVMENKSYDQALQGDYMASLASEYAVAMDYHAVAHPSLPNYLALTSGSTWDVTDDKYHALPSGEDLGSELTSAGVPWRAYMEDMSDGCSDSPRPYVAKHNPFAFYGGQCPPNVVPLSQLDADLSGDTPNFVWVTPNMCHDGHDCEVSEGDKWLSEVVPKITESAAWKEDGVLFIVWDEDDDKHSKRSDSNRVALFVVAPGLTGHQTDAYYDHYSLLATIQDRLGIERLGEAVDAQPIDDLFQP